MADDRLDSWREAQRRVLTDRRGKRGRDEIAQAAGLKYWRYVRLEQGEAELSGRDVPGLAAAFGISSSELAQDLGIIGPPPAAAAVLDWRDEFRKRVAKYHPPEDEVERIINTCEGREDKARDDYLEGVETRWHADYESAHPAPARPKRRSKRAG